MIHTREGGREGGRGEGQKIFSTHSSQVRVGKFQLNKLNFLKLLSLLTENFPLSSPQPVLSSPNKIFSWGVFGMGLRSEQCFLFTRLHGSSDNDK